MIAQMIKLWQIVALQSSESIAAFERRKSSSIFEKMERLSKATLSCNE